jgi:hypothetical protein
VTADHSGVYGRSPLVPDVTFKGDTLVALATDIRGILGTINAPMPENVHEIIAGANEGYEGGEWITVLVGQVTDENPSKRFNVSMPVRLMEAIDARAEDIGLTRSGFLQAAAREKLARGH